MKGLSRTFFSLEGAATRREWWIVSITLTVLFALVLLALLAAGPGYALLSRLDQPLVAGVVFAVMWLPSAPVTLRRLRDRGLPPWWLAVGFGWTVLSPWAIRAADRAGAELLGNLIQLGGLALSIFFIVQLGLLPSKTAAPDGGLTDAAAPDA
ncbi:DUF805 domain-containing protein [Phenylobacterium sp.]|uniref:DUF805 domain-containing protein n=1 Tax=Phenylobacterium sp. TaxID=1871053 RepID=UPI002810F064|nr:DUF805 domain-containing protein [Phenylobacterium sp.]